MWFNPQTQRSTTRMALLQCSRCGDVGHDAEHCPFFRRSREAHADAQLGDNVPHMNQVDITIRVDGASVEQCQREIGWFYNHKIEISVDNINFILGRASGEGCNCLIYSFQKILPTSMFDVLLFGRSWNGVMLGARLPLSNRITSIWPSIGKTLLTSSDFTISKV